jgi:hypothetical protein
LIQNDGRVSSERDSRVEVHRRSVTQSRSQEEARDPSCLYWISALESPIGRLARIWPCRAQPECMVAHDRALMQKAFPFDRPETAVGSPAGESKDTFPVSRWRATFLAIFTSLGIDLGQKGLNYPTKQSVTSSRATVGSSPVLRVTNGRQPACLRQSVLSFVAADDVYHLRHQCGSILCENGRTLHQVPGSSRRLAGGKRSETVPP